MMQLVKDTHLSSAIAAKGGTSQMDFASYGRVGQIIRTEYDYLRSLANGIADGSIALDGRVLQRAEQYARAGRQTYAQFEQIREVTTGREWVQNIRTDGDSCDGCIEAEALGVVRVDSGLMSFPGERTCRSNCLCRLSYSATGDG